jgi:predicted nucleotidyltransferase
MDTGMIGELMSQLAEYLTGRSEVLAAYLYGSHTEGRASALSDIDIGVLIKDGLAEEHLWQLEDAIAADLRHVLHTDKVDLVVLNLAPLRIRGMKSSPGEKCCIRLTMERALISSPIRCVAIGISRSTLRNMTAASSPESRRLWMKLNVASIKTRLQKLEPYIAELKKQQALSCERFRTFALQIIEAESQ